MKRAELLEELPVGLERCVGRIIRKRIGPKNAIPKSELQMLVAAHGFRCKDIARKIRVAVRELRRKGALICTSSSVSGFWWASDWNDAEDFIGEMRGRGSDILQTASKLEESAKDEFTQQPIRMF